jgi:DNA repair exonuclease SbcCD ATPase subunit
MKLLNFEAKNFKALRNLKLDLNYKTILISGAPGNGKTAVMAGLCYLLTDKLPEKTTIKDFVAWGAKEFEISCSFQHQNNDYKIVIIGGNGPTQKKFYINNGEPFLGKDASFQLAQVINPLLFKYSSIAEQGDTSALILDTSQARLTKLKSLLGVDDLIPVIEALSKDLEVAQVEQQQLKEKKISLEAKNFILLDVPELENIEGLEKQLESLKIDQQIFEEQEKKYNNYLQEEENYKQAQFKLSDIQQKQATLESNLLRLVLLPELLINIEELNNLSNQINQLKQEETQYNNQIKIYQNYSFDILKLEGEVTQLEKKISEIKLSRLVEPPIDLDSYNKLNTIKESIKEQEEILSLGGEGVCSKCKRPYFFNIEEIKNTINKLNIIKQEVQEKINQNKLEIESFRKERDVQETLKNQKQSYLSLKQSKLDQIEEIKKLKLAMPILEEKQFNYKELEEKKAKLTEDYKQAQSIVNFNNGLKVQQNDLKTKIAILKEKQLELEKITQPIKIEKPTDFNYSFLEDLKNKIVIHQTKKEEINRIIDYNEKLKKEEHLTKLELEQLLEQLEKKRNQELVLYNTKDVLNKAFSSYLIDDGAQLIKNRMNDFFNKAYNKYNITFKQDKNSIEFYYEDKQYKIPTPVVMASGFEKDVIALANRMALLSLQNLGIFIVDEIDSQAGDENGSRLFSLLLEEKQLNQLIVVSHNEVTKELLKTSSNAIEYNFVEGVPINGF